MCHADVEKSTAAGAATDLHSLLSVFGFVQLGTRPFLTSVYENIHHSDGSTFLLLELHSRVTAEKLDTSFISALVSTSKGPAETSSG